MHMLLDLFAHDFKNGGKLVEKWIYKCEAPLSCTYKTRKQ